MEIGFLPDGWAGREDGAGGTQLIPSNLELIWPRWSLSITGGTARTCLLTGKQN